MQDDKMLLVSGVLLSDETLMFRGEHFSICFPDITNRKIKKDLNCKIKMTFLTVCNGVLTPYHGKKKKKKNR